MYERIKLDYNSLEPYIDDKTLDLHYNIHYKNYVDKLNELLLKNNYDYKYSMEELVNRINIFNISDRGEILYNLGGTLNHELYFYQLSNNKTTPKGNFKNAIDKEFISFENFKKEFIKKALELKGSGYTFLVLDNNKLKIINTSNQDTPLSYGYIPILNIDVWEHSYYLKYKANKEKYINNFMNIIDYEKVEKLYNNYA